MLKMNRPKTAGNTRPSGKARPRTAGNYRSYEESRGTILDSGIVNETDMNVELSCCLPDVSVKNAYTKRLDDINNQLLKVRQQREELANAIAGTKVCAFGQRDIVTSEKSSPTTSSSQGYGRDRRSGRDRNRARDRYECNC